MNGIVMGVSPSVGTWFFLGSLASRLFLGGPLEKRVLCGGCDCSSPRQPIHLALRPWPSTVKIA
eukprot:scaffold62806_cov74-Cyclotella_meneghiniana.AAC.1